MSDIESRYRTVLLWYPSSWREENADVVLGTLMDEADATGRMRPRPAELASLALNGIRARFGEPVATPVRDRAALIALGTGVALSLLFFIGSEWAPFAHPADYEITAGVTGDHIPFGPFKSPGVVIYLAWLLAGFATLVKRAALARVFLIVSLVASVALAGATRLGFVVTIDAPPLFALILLSAVAVIAVLGRPSRLAHPRMALVVSIVSALAIPLWLTASLWVRAGSGVPDWGGYTDALDGYLPPGMSWAFVVQPLAWLAPIIGFVIAAVIRRKLVWLAAIVLADLPWVGMAVLMTPTTTSNLVFLVTAVGLPFAGISMLVMRGLGYRLQFVRRTRE